MIPTACDILTRPPTGTSRRAIYPGEGLLIPQRLQREQADCSSLRASSDRTVPSKLDRLPLSGTVPVSGLTAAVERAHSDRARSGSKRSTRVPFRPFIVGALRARRTVCLLLRIILRPRVARARGSSQLPRPIFLRRASRLVVRSGPTGGFARAPWPVWPV
jgi:hypothetical protein